MIRHPQPPAVARLVLLAACCLPQPAPAAIPALRWRADSSAPTPVEWTLLRGETRHLQPTVYDGRTPYAFPTSTVVTLYWQTPGMDSTWWSAPAALGAATGTLSAIWSPSNDVGAAAYSFALGARTPDGRIYSPHGTLRLRHAPGAEPAHLPLPVHILDFALVTYSNAPWATIAQAQGYAGASSEVARAAAIQTAADSAAELYQPAGDYLTEIPAEITAGAAAGITAVQPGGLASWAGTGTVSHASTADYALAAGTATVAIAATVAGTVTGVQSQQIASALQPQDLPAGIAAWAITGAVAHAAAADYATILLGDSAWIQWEGPTCMVYRAAFDTNIIHITASTPDYSGPAGPFAFSSDTSTDELLRWVSGSDSVEYYVPQNRWAVTKIVLQYVGYSYSPTLPATIDWVSVGTGTCTIDWLHTTNITAVATLADLDAALGGLRISDIEGLQDELDAKPAWASVTNVAQAAASAAVVPATNALARVAHTGEFADLVGSDIATNIVWSVVVSNGHWLIFGEVTP